MNRCLRDRTLFMLAEGDGTAAERQHLDTCPDCAARQQRMMAVSALAGRVLRESPLPRPRPKAAPAVGRWLVPAMALAMVVAVVWHEVPAGPDPALVATDASAEELSLASVSTALFGDDDDADAEAVAEPDDGSDLQVALLGDWPCEGQDAVLDPRCEQ